MLTISVTLPATSAYQPFGNFSQVSSPDDLPVNQLYPPEITAFGASCAATGRANPTTIRHRRPVPSHFIDPRTVNLLSCRISFGAASCAAHERQLNHSTLAQGIVGDKRK